MKKHLLNVILLISTLASFSQAAKDIEDFLTNKTSKFSTDGTGNSLGLKFSIKYPSSYSLSETRHPHVVAHISSGVSCACAILVNKSPETILSNEKIAACSNAVLKESIPAGAIYLSSQSGIKVEGETAGYVEYYMTRNIDKGDVVTPYHYYMREYIIYYKDYRIDVGFSIYSENKQTCLNLFNSYKQFFSLEMSSFILLSKWNG